MSYPRMTLAMIAALTAAAPALAQTAAPAATAPATAPAGPVQVTAGAAVFGPGGAPVGTIASVTADSAVVKTDRHEVNLPKNAFAAWPNGVAIGLSRDDLNATVDQANAKLVEQMKPGSPVFGAQGAKLGTIEALAGEFVTVKLENGKSVRLPKAGFGAGPNGAMIGLTAEQLAAESAAAR